MKQIEFTAGENGSSVAFTPYRHHDGEDYLSIDITESEASQIFAREHDSPFSSFLFNEYEVGQIIEYLEDWRVNYGSC
jgi:hypothetical protein